MESEKSHIELPGNIIHTIIVQPGAIGEWHFSSFQNESSVCDNHLCEHGLTRVCILNDLSQFVKMLWKVLSPGIFVHRPYCDRTRTSAVNKSKFTAVEGRVSLRKR